MMLISLQGFWLEDDPDQADGEGDAEATRGS